MADRHDSTEPVLYELRARAPWSHWFIPPVVFAAVETHGLLTAQDPWQTLGIAAASGVAFHLAPGIVERGYRWRVTTTYLVFGRLRWPFLRGGSVVPLDRITAVDVVTGRTRELRNAVQVRVGDDGTVHAGARGVVVVYVDAPSLGRYRLIIALRTAEDAVELADTLRGFSRAPTAG